ncbi:MAG: response regulator [Oleispira sp.]
MEFRIIWIDDSSTWVNSVIEELKEIFQSANFTPVIEKFTAVTDEARRAISNNYLDLLIIDCNLPEINGNEFIQELRGGRCFSHVVFYSQDANNLSLVQQDDHFSHVTPRNEFSDVIEQVADQAYRKYNHPSFMRGLLLSEFIDLESLLDDLVSCCFKSQSSYFRESIINKGGESFSLNTKLKFVMRLMKDAKAKDNKIKKTLETIDFTANGFSDKIIKRRNILAHAHPLYDVETGKVTLKSAFDDVEFNGGWLIETRNYIHDYKNKIKSVISLDLIEVVNP